MKILITHEFSGIVRKEMENRGFDAQSCDYLKTEIEGNHYQGNCFDLSFSDFDFVGAHPPCTYLCNSSVRWLYNNDGTKNIDRWIRLEEAVKHFNKVKSKIKIGYIENPIPHKYARDGFFSVKDNSWVQGIGNYTQIVQPYQFGHGEKKATCFWIIGTEKRLEPTNIVDGREQIIWKMPPSKDRWKDRSRTYPGIAKAIANQLI